MLAVGKNIVRSPLRSIPVGVNIRAISGQGSEIESVVIKPGFHIASPFSAKYNFDALIKTLPELEQHVFVSPKSKEKTINFFSAAAVVCLNKALLGHNYGVKNWHIPDGYLCPPIPSRAEYLYYIRSELLGEDSKNVRGLDIGCGASCIYPLIATGIDSSWSMVGSEANLAAAGLAEKNVLANDRPIIIRHQNNNNRVFRGIIKPGEQFDFSMCNPPFYESEQEATTQHIRKMRNLQRNNKMCADKFISKSNMRDGKKGLEERAFGGMEHELWCTGGEKAFVGRMIKESSRDEYRHAVKWFTTLVSSESSILFFNKLLVTPGRTRARTIKVIDMNYGNKSSRILCWNF
jgi:23S rRNA (adenine1618-N6)-methyltransferase